MPTAAIPGTSSETYNTSNQVTYSSLKSGAGLTYDAAGDVTYDGLNTYLYDAEGRICAVKNSVGAITGYVYDAAGIRVARLGLGGLSCNFAPGGVAWDIHASWALGQGGEQVAEFNGVGTWQHSNIYAGKLIGTYDTKGLHFYLDDWLGTRRVQTNSTGQLEMTCQSLPYGNGHNCITTSLSTADNPTEQFFTGKERDPESGDDYFEARYYNSAAGRFLSPDWSAKEEPVPYAKMDDPQTLNLYDYVRNSPVTRVDADGHVAGVDDAAEATVAAVVIGAIALEAGVQAYNRSPEGQRSLNTFTSGVSESFSSSVNSVKSTISGWFSKKSAPPPPPGKATTGPKAADAPGVSAGGQATDAHGNKVGPSGDVQVNKTKSTTREGARNKALGEGSGAVEHATPTVGAPHFHPTGADGEKKPSSTHHEYPN